MINELYKNLVKDFLFLHNKYETPARYTLIKRAEYVRVNVNKSINQTIS